MTEPTDDEALPRVEMVSIAELLQGDDSALAHAVKRVVEELGDEGNYAAHASSPTPAP